MISDVVFDFDGTLADSRYAIVDLYNQLAAKHGFKPMLAEDIEQLRKVSIRERCKLLGVPMYRVPSLALELTAKYRTMIDSVEPYEGMIPVLQALQKRGVRVGIISSNSQQNIERFLVRTQADSLVRAIYSSSNLFGKDKVISRYLKTFGLSPDQVLYVGDEHRDVVACKKTRLRMLAVLWGADSLELLSKAGPDFIAQRPEDILHRVGQLNGWQAERGPE